MLLSLHVRVLVGALPQLAKEHCGFSALSTVTVDILCDACFERLCLGVRLLCELFRGELFMSRNVGGVG